MVTGFGISLISQASTGKKFWIKTLNICYDIMLDIGHMFVVSQYFKRQFYNLSNARPYEMNSRLKQVDLAVTYRLLHPVANSRHAFKILWFEKMLNKIC